MLKKYLSGYKIILASQSPRRKELLAGTDINFESFVISGIDESVPDTVPFPETAEYLAVKKSKAYRDILADKTIVITADTVVCTSKEILNKPADKDEAVSMLQKLSGKTHKVITGVCLSTAEETRSFSDVTEVTFAQLSDEEITYYAETYKPYDKAGAYGIQEWIGYIGIKRIEGSYFNVVGLPVQPLYQQLKQITQRNRQ